TPREARGSRSTTRVSMARRTPAKAASAASRIPRSGRLRGGGDGDFEEDGPEVERQEIRPPREEARREEEGAGGRQEGRGTRRAGQAGRGGEPARRDARRPAANPTR